MSYNINQVKLYNELLNLIVLLTMVPIRVVTAVVGIHCIKALNNGAYQSCFSCSRKSLYLVNLIVLLTMVLIRVETAVSRLQVV